MPSAAARPSQRGCALYSTLFPAWLAVARQNRRNPIHYFSNQKERRVTMAEPDDKDIEIKDLPPAWCRRVAGLPDCNSR